MLDTAKRQSTAPFDTARLDRLMDKQGFDVLLVTSKHNVQYLLGGHRAFFFESMDAMGLSRYLPVLVYAKDEPQKAGFFGHRMEGFQHQNTPFWVAEVDTKSSGSVDVMERAVAYAKKLAPNPKRIGAELAFIPVDSYDVIRKAFPHAEIKDALFVLERLRAIKTPHELEMLKTASDAVIDSMQVVFQKHGPGASKAELTEALRREETSRGLTFDYCLITVNSSLNRAPSDERWEKGGVLSLDSGGNYHGYIGDVCRMGVAGEPDQELVDILAELESVQQASMKAVKPGVPGKQVYAATDTLLQKSKLHNHIEFLAHGMGLVSHEAPRLTNSGPVPYDAYDADLPLETGMVVSVETTLKHPRRGFIKLEDTVVVTPTGYEVYGDRIRGWNKAGVA
ncbi:MAG TPA: Xaa-Pro peptidase family protein [Xanthobacteraceae bacterium]|jgi:Xaa-Pro aminopeptidase|nr:Xaa-Pro peptidase family protein [Xanthobacteraceae bacterium]